MQLQKGQRDKLSKYLNTSEEVEIEIIILGSSIYEISCFGLTQNNFVNLITPVENKNSVVKFALNLEKLDANKIVFAVNINGENTMNNIKLLSLKISQNKKLLIEFDLTGEDFSNEKAITLIEFYKKNDVNDWRIACIASGFNNGFKELLNSYGITEFPVIAQEQNIKPEILSDKKINIPLNPKITHEILINFAWNYIKKTLFKPALDLNIGCLYELKTGLRGRIQSHSRDLGSLDYPPYMALDGNENDSSRKTENLRINCLKFSEIKKILIYASFSDGSNDWNVFDALITLKLPELNDINIKIDDSEQQFCAIALLEFVNDNVFSVEILTTFFDELDDMKSHYALQSK